jgi:hypothetical protein
MIHPALSNGVATTYDRYHQIEQAEAGGQLANALYRIKRQFKFWHAFKALRQPSALNSYGQVEGII